MLDELVTTNEAAAACGVDASTIRMWVFRGYLTKVGLNDRGYPVYEMGAVLVAAKNTRQRGVGARRLA